MRQTQSQTSLREKNSKFNSYSGPQRMRIIPQSLASGHAPATLFTFLQSPGAFGAAILQRCQKVPQQLRQGGFFQVL